MMLAITPHCEPRSKFGLAMSGARDLMDHHENTLPFWRLQSLDPLVLLALTFPTELQ